jgi:6-pyruvoyltetrahydropterin/6-carboxytetrahydropterin synthase
MFLISVEQSFDAAHYLRAYKGKCENLHGHRFKVVVRIKSAKLNDIGLAYDFTLLKKQLAQVLGVFDHQNLNETPPFDKINPSSENIALTVYEKLKPILPEGIELVSTEVWESPEACAIYKPD